MITATAKLRSLSAYSQSDFFKSSRAEGESHDAFEERCWREKMHVLDGSVVIPPMQLKRCLDNGASLRGEKVPGKGSRGWASFFISGVLVTDPMVLDIDPSTVRGEWIMAHADGKKTGTGGRVRRCFPLIPEWKGTATFHILNAEITDKVFLRMLDTAGKLVGIGRFRPQNGGMFGRFAVEDLKWAKEKVA